SEGRVISWGYSGYSALGRTTTTPAPDFVQRDASTELTGIVKIDASRYSVLALDEDGHVWVWGYNGYGQLGIGTTATQRYAVQIPAESLSDVTDISAGNASSLAVSNGVVKA